MTLGKGVAEVQRRSSATVAVAIFGGDLVIGRTLEQALTYAGYDARFLEGAPTDGLAESLGGVRLVLFTPRIGAARREALLSAMRSVATTDALPVLELTTTLDEVRADPEGVGLVEWPCSMEALARRIEATLIDEADL
jgi:hypothetical protein